MSKRPSLSPLRSILLGVILLQSVIRCVADDADATLPLLRTFRQEFIEITPGRGIFPDSFQMGRPSGGSTLEQPARRIHFTHSFAIARYEVPQNLWEAVMKSNPSRWKGARNSVEMVSHIEAVSFCHEATRLLREAQLIESDEEIRLPSEAEWEYCTRAGSSTTYSFGNDADSLTDFAWYAANAAGNDPPVGAKRPNPWGLFDVHGYLWEWCSDAGATTLSHHPANGTSLLTTPQADQSTEGNQTSPQSTQESDTPSRVVRGGSWKDGPEQLTSSFRRLAPSTLRDDAVGFRCVLAKRSTPPNTPVPAP